MCIWRYEQPFKTLCNFSIAWMIKTKHTSKCHWFFTHPSRFFGAFLSTVPQALLPEFVDTILKFSSPHHAREPFSTQNPTLSSPFNNAFLIISLFCQHRVFLRHHLTLSSFGKSWFLEAEWTVPLGLYICTLHIMLFYYREPFANLISFNDKISKQW